MPEVSAPEARRIDAHRAIAREIDRAAERAYSRAGAASIGVALLALIIAWPLLGAGLGAWAAWGAAGLFAIACGLIALGRARARIGARLARLAERFEGYCAANGLDPDAVRRHFRARAIYPYLDALRLPRSRLEYVTPAEQP